MIRSLIDLSQMESENGFYGLIKKLFSDFAAASIEEIDVDGQYWQKKIQLPVRSRTISNVIVGLLYEHFRTIYNDNFDINLDKEETGYVLHLSSSSRKLLEMLPEKLSILYREVDKEKNNIFSPKFFSNKPFITSDDRKVWGYKYVPMDVDKGEKEAVQELVEAILLYNKIKPRYTIKSDLIIPQKDMEKLCEIENIDSLRTRGGINL